MDSGYLCLFCVPEDVFLLWPKAGKSLEVYALFSTVRWAYALPGTPPPQHGLRTRLVFLLNLYPYPADLRQTFSLIR